MDRTFTRQTADKPRAAMPVSGRVGVGGPTTVSASERDRAGLDRVTSVTDVIRHLLR